MLWSQQAAWPSLPVCLRLACHTNPPTPSHAQIVPIPTLLLSLLSYLLSHSARPCPPPPLTQYVPHLLPCSLPPLPPSHLLSLPISLLVYLYPLLFLIFLPLLPPSISPSQPTFLHHTIPFSPHPSLPPLPRRNDEPWSALYLMVDHGSSWSTIKYRGDDHDQVACDHGRPWSDYV